MAFMSVYLNKALAESREWDQKYLRAQVQAIKLSSCDGGQDHEQLIDEFLAPRAAGMFKATNPYSKDIHLTTLMQELLHQLNRRLNRGKRKNPEDEPQGTAFALVTFTDAAWATSDKDIQFDLRAAKRRVRNALRGFEYIARFEAAYYVNEPHIQKGVTGKLVLFHCHALVWSSSMSKIRRAREKFGHRFVPTANGNSGMHVSERSLEDVMWTFGYIGKMPTLGYMKVKQGNKWSQTHARLSPAQHFRLFSWMKNHSLFDFWFASGEGVKPLRNTRSDIMKRKLPFRRIR